MGLPVKNSHLTTGRLEKSHLQKKAIAGAAEMGKQNNVVVSDAKSGIKGAVSMSIHSNLSPPLPKPKPKPRPFPTTALFCRRKVVKRLDPPPPVANAWLDSMRASSPAKSPPSSLHHIDHLSLSWMATHPSALEMFDKIIEASKGKKIVMFLDYDGTLSPIVSDPDRAFMSPQMRATVKDVAKHFPTAIVSGRCKDKVFDFVKLKELYYAGSHGMDIQGPATEHDKKSILCQPAKQFLPIIDRVFKALLQKTESIPGAKIENNKFCVSVHFRCVDEKKWGELAKQVKEVLSDYPELKMTNGRKVLEIKPTIKWDKGKALEFLLEALGFAKSDDVLPIYIGDDTTDEDAFKVLQQRKQGAGILVSKLPKETCASYTLQDPTQVMSFLQRLVAWKQQSQCAYSRP